MFIFCYVCVILFSQYRGFESFFSGNHWSEGIYNQLIKDDFLRNNYQEGFIAVMHRQVSCDYSDTLQQDLQVAFLHQRKEVSATGLPTVSRRNLAHLQLRDARLRQRDNLFFANSTGPLKRQR
ncbi:hypothetical protein EBA31_01790 [Serratia sp. P2ACOL2]|nr:hypothetical protein EBA31_01790 [Serratia sp. P2ACOL2]